MKIFNITAQILDMCSNNPKQSILYNHVVSASNEIEAKKKFETLLLIDDMVSQKILSVEEISQDAA